MLTRSMKKRKLAKLTELVAQQKNVVLQKRKQRSVVPRKLTSRKRCPLNSSPNPTASLRLYSLVDFPEFPLVKGTIKCRPSVRNRSPYVGDVLLEDGRVAIVHMPCLDMGGKCRAGATVLMRPAVDRKTKKPVGPNAVSKKYNTPRCEFILSLLYCKEPENGDGVWVGAHPSIGEKTAASLLESGALDDEFAMPVTKFQREVVHVCGTDMRTDFLLHHKDGSKTCLEVKTVVDTDFDPDIKHADFEKDDGVVNDDVGGKKNKKKKKKKKIRFYGSSKPYVRAGIFPWGNSNQKGPDGEKVVSARAIKHVRELTAIASGEKRESDGTQVNAAILFIVVRKDAVHFRPNRDACPSFARYLKEAKEAGVRVIARRCGWSVEQVKGKDAYLAGPLDDGKIDITF
eukprot:g778.t1